MPPALGLFDLVMLALKVFCVSGQDRRGLGMISPIGSQGFLSLGLGFCLSAVDRIRVKDVLVF
jgi:hypothetical protein